MKKLILMLGVVAAAFSSNADYLLWQITSEDTASLKDGYNYIFLNYSDGADNEGTLATIYAPDSAVMGATATTSLEDLKGGAKYSLFVEFMNYENGNFSQVGVTTQQLTYQQGAANEAYIIVSDSPDMKAPTASMVWHGGSVDVPEPTSGMMVMLGFAFLALKRRKV